MFTSGAPDLAVHPPAVLDTAKPSITPADEQAIKASHLHLLVFCLHTQYNSNLQVQPSRYVYAQSA